MNGEQVRCVPSSFRALNGVIEEMGISEPNPNQDSVRLLRENCQGVYSQANSVVCTAVLSRELADMLGKLKQGGRTPILFLVLSRELPGRERQDRTMHLRQLEQENIACRILSSAQELEV